MNAVLNFTSLIPCKMFSVINLIHLFLINVFHQFFVKCQPWQIAESFFNAFFISSCLHKSTMITSLKSDICGRLLNKTCTGNRNAKISVMPIISKFKLYWNGLIKKPWIRFIQNCLLELELLPFDHTLL